MYCVKCGVKLQEGVSSCPLCQTPVWNPEKKTEEKGYPDLLPAQYCETNRPAAIAILVLCLVAMLVTLIVCFKLYGELRWGGYVMLGLVLFYIVAVLPHWFYCPKGEIFVPVDHVAIALYVLYICLKTRGTWFMSFAFPVIGASCLISTGMICLLKYVKVGRYFILGGFLIVMGAFTVLVEFFEHISFGTQMFRWSLYSLSGFGVPGLFFLIVGMIPSLQHGMKKRFFF